MPGDSFSKGVPCKVEKHVIMAVSAVGLLAGLAWIVANILFKYCNGEHNSELGSYPSDFSGPGVMYVQNETQLQTRRDTAV